jgi:hypothetical protein
MRRLAALAALIALLSLVLFVTLPDRLLWQRVLEDGGHGPVFAGVAWLLLVFQGPAQTRTAATYWRAFALAMSFGVATELVQAWLPEHDPSLVDVLHDAAGAALGLAIVAWFALRRGQRTTRVAASRIIVAVALGSLALLAWEPVQCALAYAQRRAAYPALAPAGPRADAAFIAARNATIRHAALPGEWRIAGEAPALELQFASKTTPALELFEPAPDWRGHDRLAVDLTNPSDGPVELILRVLDASHDWSSEDRLNLPVVVAPRTRTTLRVSLEAIAMAPAHRRMDLARIANVMLFAPKPLEPGRLYVSEIRLE